MTHLQRNLWAGLKKGCSALYIASGESIEDVRGEMHDFGVSIDNAKTVTIMNSHQFYTPEGEFHADRVVLASWQRDIQPLRKYDQIYRFKTDLGQLRFVSLYG